MSGGPFPETDPGAVGLHADWYAANAAAGRVTAQRCECGRWRLPARWRCPACRSDRWTFEPLTDEGEVRSFTVTRRPLHFAFADAVPYAALVVATPEGVQLLVQLRPSVPPDAPDGAPGFAIGDRVRLHVDGYGVPWSERSELSERRPE